MPRRPQFVPVARIGRSVPEARCAGARLSPLALIGLLAGLSVQQPASAGTPIPRVGIPQPQAGVSGPRSAAGLANNGMPLPCGNGNCVVAGKTLYFIQGSSAIVTPGQTVAAQVQGSNAAGGTLTVNQYANSVILNWGSFDLASGNTIQFVQPSASSAAMNRIWQGSPSQIFGRIKANGQVYLLNQNGIVFGSGAQVDTAGLLASSLNLQDTDFLGSIFNPASNALPLLSDSLGGAAGPVQVLAGANISTLAGSSGRIFLAAPQVSNAGTLSAPDGQVILAAGGKVYVQAPLSTDQTTRGLVITVDNGNQAVNAAGSATNSGTISAPHGNITLAGLAVNQQGVLDATTSVSFNGSIYLTAGTGAVVDGTTLTRAPLLGGKVDFAPGSITAAHPDLGDTTTAVDSQTQLPGTVTVTGSDIRVESGATVSAPGGQINMVARLDPAAAGSAIPAVSGSANSAVNGQGSIIVDQGATLDVSGSQDVQVEVSRNFVQAQLLGNELQDSPLQRNGFLYTKTVTIDVRGVDANGNIPLANIAGYVASIGRTVAERTAAAGSITLDAGSLVALRSGSTVNLSGGWLDFQGGYAATTKLLGADGKVYDIMSAPAGLQYVGFATGFTASSSRWGTSVSWRGASDASRNYVAGYVEGRDAGSLSVYATQTALDGAVAAATVQGPNQRTPSATTDPKSSSNWTLTNGVAAPPANLTEQYYQQAPLGGALVLGDANTIRSYDVVIGHGTQSLPAGLSDDALVVQGLPADRATTTWVPLDTLAASGVNRVSVYAQDALAVQAGADFTLPADGALKLVANTVQVNAGIVAPAGSVSIAAIQNKPQGSTNQTELALTSGVSIDVDGRWVNDDTAAQQSPDLSALEDTSAGSISLASQNGLDLGSGSTLDASGGAYLSRAGALAAGKAGSISLSASGPGVTHFTSGASYRAYGFNGGGSFSLTVPALRIGGGSAASGETLVDPGFFTQGGFARYTLNSTSGLSVDAGADVVALESGWVALPQASHYATGSALGQVAGVQLLPAALRTLPVTLNLNANGSFRGSLANSGVLSIGQGAFIGTDPGGSINLKALGRITIDGTLDAPSGTISVTLVADSNRQVYDAGQSVWIGPDARLLANEVAQLTTDTSGLVHGGLVNDGGNSISLTADRGILVIQPGAELDVSGTSAVVDLPQDARGDLLPTQLQGSGGTVNLAAGEAIVLGGSLRAASGGSTASGGTLTLTLDQGLGNYPGGSGSPPTVTDQLLLTAGAATALPTGLVAGGDAPASLSGHAAINTAAVAAAGFSSAALRSRDQITLSDQADLQLAGSISLSAPAITGVAGASAVVAAPLVTLANASTVNAAAPVATTATQSTLSVQADQIDLQGKLVVSGFDSTLLQSSGDLRTVGLALSGQTALTGSLAAGGSLTLDAAQVYPSTLSSFSVSAVQALTITNSSGNSVAAPLSAAGSLSLSAPVITQDGVLRAPFGTLSLAAGQSLTLGAGSLTSVSGAGLTVPFGTTVNSTSWYAPNATTALAGAPAKAISLSAGSASSGTGTVSVNAGATVDVSGGGDLLAYESVVGPGGSKDILSASNTYAILPGTAYATRYAPLDPAYALSGGKVTVGEAIYLSAGPAGAGLYTLLPSHYALLPGACAVTLVAANDPAPGVAYTQADGSVLVAGKLATLDTPFSASRWSTWKILPAATVHAYSELDLSLADSFFARVAAENGTSVPGLPADAGSLRFAAGSNIALSPSANVDFAVASGGRGGEADFSASAIAVVSTLDPGDAALSGYLQLQASAIDGLDASRVVLGGTIDAASGTLTVGANQLLVANDAAHALTAPDLVLAARDTLSIAAGSVLTTRAGNGSAVPDINTSGDGALVRLTAAGLPGMTRTAGSTSAAQLSIGSGAGTAASVLQAAGSLTLDSAGSTRIGSAVSLSSPALRVDANTINLGVAPATASGVNLSNAELAQARQVVLETPGSVNLYGNVALGSSSTPLTSLQVDAPLLQVVGGGTAEIDANTLVLQASHTGTAPAVDTSGSLALHAIAAADGSAGQLTLGPGAVLVNGTGTLALSADHGVLIQGSGSLASNGTVVLTTPVVMAGAGSDFAITASGALQATAGASSASSVDPGAGGRLTLQGQSVQVATRVLAPAGQISAHATGSAAGSDVVLGAGADLEAPGYAKNYQGATASVDGGTVSLVSDNGDLTVAPGATVNVSGVAGANAGTIALQAAQGTLALGGTLQGQAGSGQAGGSLQVVTNTLDAATLASLIASQASGGFEQGFSLRQRSGDLSLAAGSTLGAHAISLEADAGSLELAGSLVADADAANASGGSIALWAGNNLALASTALLSAAAPAGSAGALTLGLSPTSTGTLSAAAGSRIDLAGAQPGSLWLRVPRNAAGTGIQLGGFAAAVSGAPTVTVEAVKDYGATALTQSLLSGIASTDAATLMAQRTAILAGLGAVGASATLLPGVEIDASGATTIASGGLDLSSLRYGGAASVPGVLTVRDSGTLTVAGSLSDAFDASGVVMSGSSWSYRLVAGADLAAANPLAVATSAAAGSLLLQPTALVRTGTGSIALAAAGDLSFGRQDASTSASVYTAGQLQAFPSGLQAFDISNPYNPNVDGNLQQYTANGGDIDIQAGGNLVGSASSQVVNSWLFRHVAPVVSSAGTTSFSNGPDGPEQTTWWVDFASFHMDIGTLGGGNVKVQVAGDVRDLSVALPTQGRQGGGDGTLASGPTAANLDVTGGGNLSIVAGGNIQGGSYYVEQGSGLLRAGGSIAPGSNAAEPYAAQLALGNARFRLEAGGDVDLMTAYNPFMVAQSLQNVGQAGNGPVSDGNLYGEAGYFTTYASSSAVSLLSAGGNVDLGMNLGDAMASTTSPVQLQSNSQFVTTSASLGAGGSGFSILPGTLNVAALRGDVAVENTFTLSPAASGNLSLLAGGSVKLATRSGDAINLMLADTDPSTLPTTTDPVSDAASIATLLGTNGHLTHAPNPLHAGDTTPVTVVADSGNVVGSYSGIFGSQILAGKPVQVDAAVDVDGLSVQAQNLTATDVTRITAGRDINLIPIQDQLPNVISGAQFSVAGPGELLVEAGRNVDLGTALGVITRLNTYQSASGTAALINILAGLGSCAGRVCAPDYQAFAAAYLDPSLALAAADGNTSLLHDYLVLLGLGDLGAGDAWTAFQKLSGNLQLPLLQQVLANELNLTATAHNRSGTNYAKGYAAIGTLFPGSVVDAVTGAAINASNQPSSTAATHFSAGTGQHGDIDMIYSQVRTLSAGGIDLYAPNGSLDVGLANNPAGVKVKGPTQLGVVTQASGAIDAVTSGNVNVNASRVFTVGGGDITLWSSFGNIDAGRGAKSVVLVPPPVVSINAQGQVTITSSGATNGSGIGALLTGPDQVPGNVALIAPIGVVDAGDAGIRASGNLNIAAASVLNAGNIQVGGTSTGVPQTASVALSAPPTASSTAHDSASASDDSARRLADAARASDQLQSSFKPTIVTVDVVSDDDTDAEARRRRKP